MSEELEKLRHKQYVAERKLTAAKHKEKRLQSELKRLTRSERTHRLCTRAGMMETFLREPTVLTDDDVMELLSYGRHIQHSRAARIISWKDAALRIGQLLEEGHYASNTELAEALYHEQSVLADRLVLASRDAVDGYVPTIRSIKGVFPDQLDSVIELLRSPDSFETISKEFAEFYAGYKAGEPVSRFKIYTIDQIASGLIDLTLPRREYATEWTQVPQPAGFITEDEIDTLFVSGPPMSGGKQRVFDYFSQHHSPKEEIAFLKNEYGISGHNNALPGSFRSDVMFDGKGMTLKKPGCARVEMRWNQIHDRIRNLVRKDSYLSAGRNGL